VVADMRGDLSGLAAPGTASDRISTRAAETGDDWQPAGYPVEFLALGGLGSGMFPLSLTMIGLRSRGLATTAALSAFVQGIGYLLAGTGPLLVGVLLGISDSWTWPMVLLILAALGSAVTGWYAGRGEYVDDQLQRPARTE